MHIIAALSLLTTVVLLSVFIQGYLTPIVNQSTYAATTLSDFNFAAVGDWGCTPNTINTVNNILDKNPELILALGDFSYHLTANCWLKVIQPLDEIMKIVIGNHDNESSSLLNQYMNYFHLTKQFYSFNYQNVHFLIMSTDIPYEVGSEQYKFVENDLAKAASDSNIDWIVVSSHAVAYTSRSTLQPKADLRNIYHPLFDIYDVDLVLQGHQHNYQRTYPIKHNKDMIIYNYFGRNLTDSVPNPILTDIDTNNYDDPEGSVFAIVGTGGASIFNFTGNAPNYIVSRYAGFGFLNVDLIKNGTTLNGKFYANDGTIKDQFTITKTNNNQKRNDKHNATISDIGPRINYKNNYTAPLTAPIFKGIKSPSDMALQGANGIYDRPAPTAVKFFDSGKLAKQYQNHMFIEDFNKANHYYFESNKNGTELVFSGSDSDKVANSSKEFERTIFEQMIGGTTGLEVGPVGYLYRVSYTKGTIYWIFPPPLLPITTTTTTTITNESNFVKSMDNQDNSSDGIIDKRSDPQSNISSTISRQASNSTLSSELSVLDFDAVANDSIDDTNAFRQAVALASRFTNILHIPPGIYDIGGQIDLPSNIVIEGENQNNTIIVRQGKSSQGNIFQATGKPDSPVANITIRNLTIIGSGFDATSGNCISFVNVDNYIIENTKFSDCGGVQNGASIYTRSTSNGKISHNMINIPENGIIIGGHFINITSNTIDINPATAEAVVFTISDLSNHILIKDNDLTNCRCIIRNHSVGNDISVEQ